MPGCVFRTIISTYDKGHSVNQTGSYTVRSTYVAVVVLIVTVGVLTSPMSSHAESGQPEQGDKGYKLADLAWLAGDWRSQRGGDVLQEIWSEPLGDSMMCSFRWMKGGKSWMYELVTITQSDNEITLRLKHFSSKLVGWEDKDECLDFALVELTDRKAVFEHPTRTNAKRLIFQRPSDDVLIARVEGLEDDGSTTTLEIEYKRHGS